MVSPAIVSAALLALAPFLVAAFAPERLTGWAQSLPSPARLLGPSILCLPYLLVSLASGVFSWIWLILYASLPVAVAVLVSEARRVDPEQRGNWRDFLVLIVLGLAVDLRWFEHAWPPRLAVFGKVLLLDAGIYAFLTIRQLDGVGLDLRLRSRDLTVGLREFAFYALIAIPLGIGLGFLHVHPHWPHLTEALGAFIFTFFLVAAPEEIFFRGWLQNLFERRLGRTPALLVTAAIFGLSHWNKRAAHFNWRYVLLATLAGIFYGRAWLHGRRVGASAVTHACVDTVWSLWLR